MRPPPQPVTLLFALLVLLLLAAPAGSRGAECTDDDADSAEQELGWVIDRLKSAPGKRGAWDHLHLALRRYRTCDEEELAELFSQAVCKQLAQGWKDAPAIALAVRRDPELQGFLLGHLDHGCAPADLDLIQQNAVVRCPRYGQKLCAAVKARVVRVLEDHPARPREEP